MHEKALDIECERKLKKLCKGKNDLQEVGYVVRKEFRWPYEPYDFERSLADAEVKETMEYLDDAGNFRCWIEKDKSIVPVLD